MNTSFARLSISLFLALPAASHCSGRIEASWTYQEMFDKADLVVIADGISTKDTDERSTLTDVQPPVPVVGVTTEFRTRLVLKGAPKISAFGLHHYRFANEKDELVANAPDLVRLSNEPNQRSMFLMFLIKERDGRYAPVTGQTDPAIFSVLKLHGGAN